MFLFKMYYFTRFSHWRNFVLKKWVIQECIFFLCSSEIVYQEQGMFVCIVLSFHNSE